MGWMEPFLHWLAVHTGTLNEPGPYYGFFSGFGSDIGELAIIGGLVTLYRRHTCHQAGCWRISRHVVNGSPWCNKHHDAARLEVDASPPFASIEAKLDKLSGDISGLAEAIRGALLTGAKR